MVRHTQMAGSPVTAVPNTQEVMVAKSPSPTGDGEAGELAATVQSILADHLTIDAINMEIDGVGPASHAIAALRRTQPPQATGVQVGWAYQDSRWGKDRWHLCGDKPNESEGRQVKPVYILSSQPTGEQPVAWIIPGDGQADSNGFIMARISREAEFTKPLYVRPAPQPTEDVKGLLNALDSESACDPACEGRCRQCPDDLFRRAAAAIRSADSRLVASEQKRTELQEAFDQHFRDQGEIAYVGIRDFAAMKSRAEAAEARVEVLEKALHKIIEMNVQYAKDRYGDEAKAEDMACVSVARAALTGAGKGERG